MGRPLRIVIPGGIYHLVSRGNERKNIFRDDVDRITYIKLLAAACKKNDCILLAYVLMSNHYHLLVKINRPILSMFMRDINGSYAMYFNRKHRRCGHLFQDRFYGILIEHGLEVQRTARYIHMNPIRAGIVRTQPEYAWSSHSQYEGCNGIARPEHILKLFADTRAEAIDKYKTYMAEAEMLDWKKEAIGIYGGYILGSTDFVTKIKLLFKEKDLSVDIAKRTNLKNIYEPNQVINSTAEFFEVTAAELLTKKGKWNEGKKYLVYLLSKDCGLSHTAISKLLAGLHYTGIGKTVALLDKEKRLSGTIREKIDQIRASYIVKVSAVNKDAVN